MDVIPVIDLMGGEVVHARRGERGSYQPIRSGLVDGSGPLAIAGALMKLAPFRRLYVADIDAIRGGRGHDHAVAALAAAYPDLELWIDRGAADVEDLFERREAGEGVAVIGSESFEDARTLGHALKASQGVLSLDHDASGPIGPAAVHDDPSLWPEKIIVMTLGRVGADSGPDFERLQSVVSRADGRAVYAAGGVRGIEDLRALQGIGVAGALVASALHDGRLSGRELSALQAAPR
ncbi:HisA/HisF-related TIM barrel protein [Chenggangzhangella methanolivorans]|uniref:HisA/HisF-related TIM barrel protein n=1 Tax=Chenggangzhangella methanolivorans TaxID=1437009 RepID=UPI0036087063